MPRRLAVSGSSPSSPAITSPSDRRAAPAAANWAAIPSNQRSAAARDGPVQNLAARAAQRHAPLHPQAVRPSHRRRDAPGRDLPGRRPRRVVDLLPMVTSRFACVADLFSELQRKSRSSVGLIEVGTLGGYFAPFRLRPLGGAAARSRLRSRPVLPASSQPPFRCRPKAGRAPRRCP